MLVSVPIAVLFLKEKMGLHEYVSVGCAAFAVLALSYEIPSQRSDSARVS